VAVEMAVEGVMAIVEVAVATGAAAETAVVVGIVAATKRSS
jgi:hypothetical protein